MSTPFSLKNAPAPEKVDLPPAPEVSGDLFLDLNSIEVSRELAIQFSLAKSTFASAQNDASIPLNQKAQVLNTCAAILSAVVKTQEAIYNVERIKTLEEVLIKTLQGFPDIKQVFLDAYEQALEAADGQSST